MYRCVEFPPESIDDLLAVLSINQVQLGKLVELTNTANAIEPVDVGFLDEVSEALAVEESQANRLLRLAIVLKRANLDPEVAADVVDDMAEAVKTHLKDDGQRAAALQNVENLRPLLTALATRSDVRIRIERQRRIQQGTQPEIDEIRTLVHLRPFFEEDNEGDPTTVECLLPAMTLELKFKRDDRFHSATFSLNEETLRSLIRSLERAEKKWNLINTQFSTQICR